MSREPVQARAVRTPVTGNGLVIPTAGVARAIVPAFGHYLTLCYERFVALGDAVPERGRDAHRRVVALIRRAAAENPRAVVSLFASPTLGTPLQCLALRDALPEFRDRIDAATAAVVPNLLLELSLRRAIPEGQPIEWLAGAPPIASLSLGARLEAPAGADGLRFESGGVSALAGADVVASARFVDGRLESQGFLVTRPYHTLAGVARFATVDHNPLAAFEAHPDKQGNHVDLGGREPSEWAASLEDALRLIEAHLPEVFGEMSVLLHEIIPVGYDEQKHLSASYREAIGSVYVTLHPNLMTMAEALVHEFQHNKANVAAYGAEFLRNAYSPLYKSPVRPDPRPLWGILLAVHAFLPVAVLYRRMRAAGHPRAAAADFERRLAEIDLKNHEGMEMLRRHAEWTPAGRALMAELDALDRAHMLERAARGLNDAPTEAHIG